MKEIKSGQTGPKSSKGKRNSSLNALKHGAYSKTILLPSEDVHAYEKKRRQYQKSLRAKDELGRDLSNMVLDHQWVAHRLKSQIMAMEHDLYQSASPIEFAKFLGVPETLISKAPAYLVNPSHQISPAEQKYAQLICDQISSLKSRLPNKPSLAELDDNYPELKQALLDRFGRNDEISSELMVDLNNANDLESICLGGLLWKLDEIYAPYFYTTIFESIKPQLQFYLEKQFVEKFSNLNSTKSSHLFKLRQRLDKELNATRSTVQLMMNYNKLQHAHDEMFGLDQKNRNEMLNSRKKSKG
jgi:hypothetical protein